MKITHSTSLSQASLCPWSSSLPFCLSFWIPSPSQRCVSYSELLPLSRAPLLPVATACWVSLHGSTQYLWLKQSNVLLFSFHYVVCFLNLNWYKFLYNTTNSSLIKSQQVIISNTYYRTTVSGSVLKHFSCNISTSLHNMATTVLILQSRKQKFREI